MVIITWLTISTQQQILESFADSVEIYTEAAFFFFFGWPKKRLNDKTKQRNKNLPNMSPMSCSQERTERRETEVTERLTQYVSSCDVVEEGERRAVHPTVGISAVHRLEKVSHMTHMDTCLPYCVWFCQDIHTHT